MDTLELDTLELDTLELDTRIKVSIHTAADTHTSGDLFVNQFMI